MIRTGYIALGSNIENRIEHLRRAVALLSAHEAIEVAGRSAIYETQSVEGGGSADFLNAVLRLHTTLSAHQLLDAVQRVEQEMGRPQPPREGPRLIDIDLLMLGAVKLQTQRLTLPHPRMMERGFVLRPLCDVLEGGWVRPWNEEWE